MSDDRPAIACPEPIDVVVVRTPDARWQARFCGQAVPIGEGATSKEAVGNLVIKLSDYQRRRRPINVTELEDTGWIE